MLETRSFDLVLFFLFQLVVLLLYRSRYNCSVRGADLFGGSPVTGLVADGSCFVVSVRATFIRKQRYWSSAQQQSVGAKLQKQQQQQQHTKSSPRKKKICRAKPMKRQKNFNDVTDIFFFRGEIEVCFLIQLCLSAFIRWT